ncbi:MAG: DNA polymerase III subunit gamma/tau, partial [Pseudomonadota bacterium]
VRSKPSSARYKVYIVDEVHMLSKAAFNGLLKTLEEPPEHVKFIFATTEIRKVPITVLSRCQRFDLRRVEADQLVVHLQSVASQEGVTANADALAMIVRASEGSVRDALSLLDQAIAHGAGAVEAETTRDMLGLADRGMVIDLFEAVMRGDVPGALDIFDSQYNIGAEPSAVLGDLARFTHLVTRLKVVPDAASDRSLSETERDRATEMAPGLSMADLTRTWQILLKGIPEVDTASLPKAAADMLVVRLAYAASLPSPEDALKALGDGRDTTGGRVGGASAAPQRPSGGGPASAALRVSDPRIADPIASASPRSEASAAQPRSHLSLASDRSAPEPMAQTTPDAELPTIAYAGPALATLEDVVALADDKRDRLLAAQITRYVRLVAMQPGRIEMNLEAGAPTDLMQTLGRKLYDWTGARWMISLSREPGAEPLRVQAEAARQAVMDDIRDSPTVAAVLATFPGAKIVNVRFPDNEDDDAEDDGTPDPPIDPDDLDTEDDLL